MKELLKSVFEILKKMYWTPLVNNKDSLIEGFCYLILAFQVWCLNLAVYLTIIIVGSLFCFLKGELPLFWKFTRSWFYDDGLFGFEAWRVHIVLYIFCLFFTFKFAE